MATGHYLEVINDLYMAEDLLPLFLKFSTVDAKPKLKVKLFDIFVDLVEKSENYFDSVSVVKGYIKVVFGMIDPSMKQLSEAGMRAIEIAKDKNAIATFGTIFEMDTASQKLIRSLFREYTPHIEEELKSYMHRTHPGEPVQEFSAPPRFENSNSSLVINLIMQLKQPGTGRYDGLK